ncbi:MAG TPA: hypothetical protein VK821_15920 [Dehalococcoidia bacterium]|nr:hypothetical protein [Dehalococcoidia bacterium]
MITLALVIGMLSLLAMAPRSGVGHVAPPAAGFDINFQATGRGSGLEAEVTGVANRTGEVQASLSTAQPEAHTIDLIAAESSVYLSLDGAPYETLGDFSGLGALGAPRGAAAAPPQVPGGLPPGCGAMTGAFGPLLGPAPGQTLSELAGIKDLGPANVDGAVAEHYSGTVDLGSVLASPLVEQEIRQTLSACGGGSGLGFDPSILQPPIAGSTLDMDSYVDQGSGLPRKFTLTLDLLPLSLRLSASGRVTPLDAPATINAP